MTTRSASLRAKALERTPLGSPQFRAVIGASLLIMMGFGLIVPALPLFARRFGVGEAGVGLVLTVFAGTRLLADFFAGSLIDRWGERTVTTAGAVIVGVSSISAGAAGTFPMLVLTRGAGGVGSAMFLGGLMAYLVGTVPEMQRGRAMSIFQASVGIGLLLGPMIGGLVIAVAPVNVPLYLYGIVCFACAPLCMRAMSGVHVPSATLADAPEVSESVPGPTPAWRSLRPLLRNSSYRAALAVSAATFLVTQALQTLLPLLWRDQLLLSKASTGLPFTVMALTAIVVVWHAGSLSDRRGRKFALVPALAVTAVGTAMLGIASSGIAIVAVMALLGASTGYTRPGPTAMVADVAPPDARGIAVSGYRIAGDVGSFVGPIMAGGIAQEFGYTAAFASTGAVVAVALLVAVAAAESAPRQRT